MKIKFFKNSTCLLTLVAFLFLSGQAWATQETPIKFPKQEGSRSFDFEISQINDQAIKKYSQSLFQEAAEQFKKALILSRQFRDPGQGILHYNLALSLHKSGNHENALKQFNSAKRLSRGNSRILNSELMKMHECGFNPNILCGTNVPPSMNIEGSH